MNQDRGNKGLNLNLENHTPDRASAERIAELTKILAPYVDREREEALERERADSDRRARRRLTPDKLPSQPQLGRGGKGKRGGRSKDKRGGRGKRGR